MIWGIYHTKLYCLSNISQTESYGLPPRISFSVKNEKKGWAEVVGEWPGFVSQSPEGQALMQCACFSWRLF